MYLNCKTRLSFRYGIFSTEELVNRADAYGISNLALTNINNTADAWDFVDFCRKVDINPVLGAEIRNENQLIYLLLAKNDWGFQKINRFLSNFLCGKKPFPKKPEIKEDIWIIYPFSKSPQDPLKPYEKIGVTPSEVNRLFGISKERLQEDFVIRQPVTFNNKQGFNCHRLLRAIDNNILLSQQQSTDYAPETETFLPPRALKEAFKSYPEIIKNTHTLLSSCEIKTLLHTGKNRNHFKNSEAADNLLLRELALKGLQERYGKQHKKAEARINKELKIIKELQFTAYFLIANDVVQYAKRKGFFYVGRGSGANSIVAYCLHITDVDPIALDLYFERFLNPARTSPPDFDMDFSWADRDKIIRYVFKKYGAEHVALLGMFTTFQHRAVIRELGKVFGLPSHEIEALSKSRKDNHDKVHRQILKYGRLLTGLPNHLSIHAGGMLISEKPIYQYLATELPPKGFPTAQIDMFLSEKIGLFKFDILSQRGLGHIKDAVDLVKKTTGDVVNIHNVQSFLKDKNLISKLKEGDTIGCFYIESPAMRQLLKKLHCHDYLTLVAASSIIRPGVAKSGMMRQFIYYHHHPDNVEYPHPILKDLLAETYGVMVYQEDVIKVAHYFAGLTMAEADILRRAMSGKYRSKSSFQLMRQKFFDNCRKKGHAQKLTTEIWRQMESFAGYSFSKAHSASYAVESFQSLYLKTYYPVAFMVAVINNDGGFYNTELYFQELKKTGVTILPPCVNHGRYLTDIVAGKVYVGFRHILNLDRKTADLTVQERQKSGCYKDLNNFIERTNLALEQLNLLIKVGAFNFTGKGKKELLWEANLLRKRKPIKNMQQRKLFEEKHKDYKLPDFPTHPLEKPFQEIELLGFTLGNIFDLVADDPEKYLKSKNLPQFLGKKVTILGYFVTLKPVKTVKQERMYFGVFLDKSGDWIDTVHFPKMARDFPFWGHGFYRITGIVNNEFDTYSITVKKMEKVGLKSRE